MKRICPNCQNNLGEHESYFCLSCGRKLEDNMIHYSSDFIVNRKNFIEESVDTFPKLNLKLHIDKKIQTVAAIVIGLGLFSIFVIFLSSKLASLKSEKVVEETKIVEQKPVYNNTKDLKLEQENFSFGDNDILKFVPANVNFYVEGKDFDRVYNLFYGNDRDDSVFELVNFQLDGKFVLFGQKIDNEWKYAVVILIDDERAEEFKNKVSPEVESDEEVDEDTVAIEESEEEELTEEEIIEESPDYYYGLIENALVITNYESFIESIEENATGTTKTIKHNPKYSRFSSFLPKSGQIIVMDFTENFDSVYGLFESFYPSDEVVKMLEPIIQEKYTKFVVRKDE